MTARRRSIGWLPFAVVLIAAVVTVARPIEARAVTAQDSTCAPDGGPVVTGEPWPQRRLGVAALGQQYSGWGITIAVLSSGVSARHPQLRGRVLNGLTVGDAGAANDDCLGFGTAISGAAAAAPVSGTPLAGVAPQSSVLPVRLPDWVVNPSSSLDDEHLQQASTLLGQAITLALQRDPQVMVLPSVSLPDSPELRAAAAAAEEQGCLLIEGAPTMAEIPNTFPAAYPEVLVVEGESPDGEYAQTALPADELDLIAPGVQVPVLSPGAGHQLVTSNTVAAGYTAGAAALVLDALHPRTTAEARRLLLRSNVTSTAGRIPVLDPASALTPDDGAAAETPGGPLGRLLGARSAPDRATVLATAVAVAALAGLGIILFAGAATYRGRQRGWRPAGRREPGAPAAEQFSLADDPFRPPGRLGPAWPGRPDGPGGPDRPGEPGAAGGPGEPAAPHPPGQGAAGAAAVPASPGGPDTPAHGGQ